MKKILLIITILVSNLCYSSVEELCSNLRDNLTQCYNKNFQHFNNNDHLKTLLNKYMVIYPELIPLLEINFKNYISIEEKKTKLDQIKDQLDQHCSRKKTLTRTRITSLIKSTNDQLEETEKLIQHLQTQIQFSIHFEMAAFQIHKEYVQTRLRLQKIQKEYTAMLENYLADFKQIIEWFDELTRKSFLDPQFTIDQNLREKIARLHNISCLIQSNHNIIHSSNETEKVNLTHRLTLNNILDEYPKLVEYHKEIGKRISQLIDIIQRSVTDIEPTKRLLNYETQRYNLQDVD